MNEDSDSSLISEDQGRVFLLAGRKRRPENTPDRNKDGTRYFRIRIAYGDGKSG